MDRPEPGLIKWSPNAAFNSFLHINLGNHVVQVYEPLGHAKNGSFEYKKVSQHDDFPPLTTYDWSPSIPGLVAVGTSAGIVNLLRIDDNSNAYLELKLKMARTCQAVAFSTQGMLAVGLDRVRSDQCLYVWDVSRLSSLNATGSGSSSGSSNKGFPSDVMPFTDPSFRLEPSVSVSSVKFFEDNPNTLAVGIKGQGLRIHDLRDPSPAITFHTKCNNNLAIDYADPNYFASSALDQPGIMVWDRRATTRQASSAFYLDAVDDVGLPWGGALRLDNALELESSLAMTDAKHSFIRSLRYSRDHRGMLAVLSRAGQLKILTTNPEIVPPEQAVDGSAVPLNVRKSYEMDNYFSDLGRKNSIVSFDWITMESPLRRPRLLVLRASGAFEVLELPSFTGSYPYKLVPWQAPHRGLEGGGSYHSMIQLEPQQAAEILAPVAADDEMSDIPLFGPDKADVSSIVRKALQAHVGIGGVIENAEASQIPLPDAFTNGSNVGGKLRALRQYAKEVIAQRAPQSGGAPVANGGGTTQAKSSRPESNRERHEHLLSLTMATKGFPLEAQMFLDHIALLRAKEKYLFDCDKNRSVVCDDPWLRDTWAWISGAEEAAADGGMMSHPLDLSYMGVASIWLNDLGNNPSTRLAEGATATLDAAVWERAVNVICKRRGFSKFEGVETKRPHHRQLCIDICGWGRSVTTDFLEFEQIPSSEKTSTWHTMMVAHALFRGDAKQAVQLLKEASLEHPALLFVSLALQLIWRGDAALAKEQLDFDETVASQTDPYLRAISSYIASGDWLAIADQRTLPLRERAYVAARYLTDEQLTRWLRSESAATVETGDIEGIVLHGITDRMVDVLARYVGKFHDVQTATLIASICAPRYIDDIRCAAWRKSYRAYLQRHRAFYQRTKFEVESTKRSKREGQPTIKPPFRQIALRCIYCDSETSLGRTSAAPASSSAATAGAAGGPVPAVGGGGAGASVATEQNPLMAKLANAGISCPTCKRHLPRCVVCLEVVGLPRSDKPEASTDPETRLAARFPTFCLKCEHVLHLDHARQWFARHVECPVPECRCRCNFRANPELNYQ